MNKFLILGNKNAITYKDIFHYIKNNQLWLGLNSPCCFSTPSGEVTKAITGLCRWFTNIPHDKNQEPLVLTKTYNSTDYQKYDNYDAIEVSKVKDIPVDYDGVMGVPITFLDKYCNSQFEIVGITQRNDDPYKIKKYTKKEYKNANDLNRGGVIIVNGVPKTIYQRILIRRKNGNI